MSTTSLSISAVERETGLSKDVLRVWERRYGFPVPLRDAHGERLYPADQVDRLRTIKRLMDQGHRPGKLLAATPDELRALAPKRKAAKLAPPSAGQDEQLDALIEPIRRHDAAAFLQLMQQRLARQGLLHFVQDTIAPLTWRIGLAWEEGRIQVFEEHLYTELTKRLLRQAIGALAPGSGRPRVILTSVPEEQHVLGLLMVEAQLTLDGAECIPLGTQMPLIEIVRAASAHRADIVALSFSVAFPSRRVPGLLDELRRALPDEVALWVGGAGVRHVRSQPGLHVLHHLDQTLEELAAWRARHAAS